LLVAERLLKSDKLRFDKLITTGVGEDLEVMDNGLIQIFLSHNLRLYLRLFLIKCLHYNFGRWPTKKNKTPKLAEQWF
jgi:hypothetical protein